jgi:50S ribosomal protein L16 3-hydroxylase
MDAQTLFGKTLPGVLLSSPDVFRRDVVYTFVITGDGGGKWTLSLRGERPSCQPGDLGNSECRVEVSHEDFRQMIADPSGSLMDLYYQNRIKVVGDVYKAAELPQILSLATSSGADAVGLELLLAPLPAKQFLAEHWPNRHLAVHGPLSRLGPLARIPELADVHALLRAWRGTVRVFPPASGDEYDSPQVTSEVAARLYDRGFALVFNAPETLLPALQPHLRKLQVDLGLPANTNARCIAYASPTNAGASPHFDHNANFVVQLTGEKVWRVAPNRQVTNPTVRHVMNGPVDPALLVQATGDFPGAMPPDAEEIHLRAGSVLFVPNASWHTTSAAEGALSLNFTFSQPSWADLVRDAIWKRLITDPQWRELAYGASPDADPARREQASRRLTALLQQLPEKVRTLNAAAVIRGVNPRSGSDAVDTLDLKRDWLKTLLPEGGGGQS